MARGLTYLGDVAQLLGGRGIAGLELQRAVTVWGLYSYRFLLSRLTDLGHSFSGYILRASRLTG